MAVLQPLRTVFPKGPAEWALADLVAERIQVILEADATLAQWLQGVRRGYTMTQDSTMKTPDIWVWAVSEEEEEQAQRRTKLEPRTGIGIRSRQYKESEVLEPDEPSFRTVTNYLHKILRENPRLELPGGGDPLVNSMEEWEAVDAGDFAVQNSSQVRRYTEVWFVKHRAEVDARTREE